MLTATLITLITLLERLLAAATHFGTGLLSLRALTGTRHVGHDDLMHEGLVEFLAEGNFGQLDSCSGNSLQVHVVLPQAFTDGRTMTSLPVAPGTAPLTTSTLRSTSTETISRPWMVTRSAPM